MRSLRLVAFARDILEGNAEVLDFEHLGRAFRATPLEGLTAFQIEDISQIRRVEKLQREFTASVSHELSTPLTAVKGLLETALLSDKLERELVERALRRLGDLERLVESVRLLVLLDSKREFTRERFSLMEPISRILEDLSEEIASKGLEVELSGDELEVESDREKLYILLKNLLENAVRYNREGGKLRVRIERSLGRTRIAVEDTGVGIPKEEIPLLFQPFFGGKNRKGMGLGLAISKKIADFLGAELKVRSEEGKGTTVEVLLP